ncbi:MAG: helix-turn-helix domain-containing protein [Actinomycetota bacterium]
MPDRLTTSSVAGPDRLAYWREVICAVYVELDVEAVGGDDFSGSVDLTGWGDTRISHVASCGQIVTRSPDSTRADCLISLQLSGTCRISQFGRTASLGPGDFALYDTTAPYELAFDRDFDQVVVQFPRHALAARNVDIESAVARTCSGTAGVGAVAASFVRALADHHGEIADVQRPVLGQQAVDVSAAALATMTGARPTGESVRAHNRQRVLTFVERHLDDPDLSVGWVAASLGVSPRTIQKLFADDDVPLSGRIREARLARAERALRDPARRHHTIARIALDLGYGSPEHFARAFRAGRGVSPRDYRAAADG